MGISIQQQALEDVIRLASLGSQDPEWVGAVYREVAGWESSINLKEKIRAEMFHSLASIRMLKPRIGASISMEENFRLYIAKRPMATDGIPDKLESRSMMARVLPIYIEWDRILKEHPDDIKLALTLCKEFTDSVTKAGRTYTDQYSFLFLPVVDSSGLSFTELHFRLDATQEFLRCLELRARTGQWPVDAALTVDDPFSDDSAKAWVESDRLVIYSVGQNGIDDRKSENWGVNGFNSADDILIREKL